MNETCSHFVSGCLSLIARLRGLDFASNPALSMILNAFITGLESDALNPETFQKSMASPKTYSLFVHFSSRGAMLSLRLFVTLRSFVQMIPHGRSA